MRPGPTQCPPPSVHSALNATDRCALCVCYRRAAFNLREPEDLRDVLHKGEAELGDHPGEHPDVVEAVSRAGEGAEGGGEGGRERGKRQGAARLMMREPVSAESVIARCVQALVLVACPIFRMRATTTKS